MSAQENKELICNHYEKVWNKGDFEFLEQNMTADFIHNDPADQGGITKGREGFKKLVSMYRTVFPDLHFSIEDVIVEGDKTVVRWTARGTHKGELMGIAPTGKKIAVTGISIDRIEGGKLAES